MLLGLVSAWLSPPQDARAQSESGYDLINTVNALRASLGLAAYTVDPWLMTYAQQHADYINSLNSGTHLHSDGTLPWDSGIQENVAGGTAGYVTAAVVVYQIWVDEGHLKTMTGYPGGEIGAGVAYSADNDQTYFVIDVRPASAEDVAALLRQRRRSSCHTPPAPRRRTAGSCTRWPRGKRCGALPSPTVRR